MIIWEAVFLPGTSQLVRRTSRRPGEMPSPAARVSLARAPFFLKVGVLPVPLPLTRS